MEFHNELDDVLRSFNENLTFKGIKLKKRLYMDKCSIWRQIAIYNGIGRGGVIMNHKEISLQDFLIS